MNNKFKCQMGEKSNSALAIEDMLHGQSKFVLCSIWCLKSLVLCKNMALYDECRNKTLFLWGKCNKNMK